MHYSGFTRVVVVTWLKIKAWFSGYGYFGDYKTWSEASLASQGYDQESIIEKVKSASLKVKNGEAGFERDGLAFDSEFEWEILAWFDELAASKENLRVLDFGGALGSHYYPLAKRLGKEKLDWTIIEQEAFIEIGKKEFEDEHLHFVSSLGEALKLKTYDVILFGCVLPYLPKPYDILSEVKVSQIPNIIIDKHPVLRGKEDVLKVQKISPTIYSASYPAWFFSESKFLNFMNEDYQLDKMVLCADIFNVNSYFKSYFYKLKQ